MIQITISTELNGFLTFSESIPKKYGFIVCVPKFLVQADPRRKNTLIYLV